MEERGEEQKENTPLATVAKTIEEPQGRAKEKSEKSWWRRQGPTPIPTSPDSPPTTPTSPTLPDFQTFEFVLPSRVKLLTLNEVFGTPKTISWSNEIATKTKDDCYRDTITVSWDQTIESKRSKPNYPHLVAQENEPKSSKIGMEFIGKQREVPASGKPAKKNGVGSFIPRKDAQEFRPSKPQVQEDYYYRTEKLLEKLQRPPSKREMKTRQQYDDYSSKRPVKADAHHLPHNYNDTHYSDYVDRGKYSEYSSRSMGGARERHHQQHLPHEDPHADHQYPPHSGYKEDYRGDSGREPTYARHYDRDQVARVYYDKERLYHQQNSHIPTDRDRRHMYDMSTEMPDILSRYERRRREELEYRHRDRYQQPSGDRINTYDEYERVVTERQRRQVQERRRPRGMEDYSAQQHSDPRWREYYRMKYDELRRRNETY